MPGQDPTQRILIVEDEAAINEALAFGLEAEGFDVVTTFDGVSGWAAFEQDRPDLVILDVMLPGRSGTDICRMIRAQSTVPVIMLSAKDSEIDKVVGLEIGADDYITKPFSMRELIARVRAVLRRVGDQGHEDSAVSLSMHNVHIDTQRHEVQVRGKSVDLRPKEFALLELLVRHAGHVLGRDMIIEHIWGADYVGDTKTLDVHIKRIRARIERDPKQPELIQTIRGVGYKFID
ncbi:response regulator transcription factor [Stomatohabitans albus]|uniref:response regulator transcription factor n=1 Tax=Stomatohabitans albus TaxID=3110766 RepID=UPI00300C0B87